MDTPDPLATGGNAAVQRGTGTEPTEWAEEYEAAPDTERFARLAADQELVFRIQFEGFDGKTWFLLSRALVAYGTQVLRMWVRTGRIFGLCREKGFKVKKPPPQGMSSLDAESLADETVAFAVTRFQNEVLAAARWDQSRGASLKTFFIGMCLKQFATTYTEWCRRSLRRSKENEAEMDIFYLDDKRAWLPETLSESVEEEFADIISDEVTRGIVRLRDEGYSQAEISELLDISEGAIESRIYRLRRLWRERPPREGGDV